MSSTALSRRTAIGPLALAPLVVLAGATASVSFLNLAAALHRQGSDYGLWLYWLAQLVFVGATAWAVMAMDLSRRAYQWVCMAFFVVPGVLSRMADPLLLAGYDEQLHARSLADLLVTHRLLSDNPMLPISPYFPGLETVTATVHDLTRLPVVLAAAIVVLVARALLGLAVFEGAKALHLPDRLAALVALLYGACPQFYFFNSQFAYQTLAVGLGIAGLVLVRKAQQTTDGRARNQLLVAAGLALAACAVTHHITSWLVAAFALAWWLVTPRGAGRAVVRTGALVALISVVVWDSIAAEGLYQYLSPVASAAGVQFLDFLQGRSQRHYLQDSSGEHSPLWQTLVLLGYTALTAFLALGAAFWAARRARVRRNWPLALLAALCCAYPLTLAARVTPVTAELGERLSTFVFLPWAVVVALALGRLLARRDGGRRTSAAVVALLAFIFVGGNLLGSGPDWEKLPGSWLAAAQNRSLDSETLAAASWAQANVPAGTRVVADRMPAALLSSRAQVWPVTQPNSGLDVAALYYSRAWGPDQSALLAKARVSLLYVDERLATQLPHDGSYFYDGESTTVQRLPEEGLTKFATVPGLRLVYAHGPVHLYSVDAQQFGFVPLRTGLTSRGEPAVSWLQVLVGLVAGVLLTRLLLRRRAQGVGRISPAGDSRLLLVLSTAVSGTVLLSTLLFAIGLAPRWPFAIGLLLPMVVLLRDAVPVASRSRRPEASTAVFVVLCAGTMVLWVGNGVLAAHDTDVQHVNTILQQVGNRR